MSLHLDSGYPPEFSKKVKDLLPEEGGLHKFLDEGSEQVGLALSGFSSHRIEPQTIISLIDEGKVDELRSLAERQVKLKEAYSEWGDIFEPEYEKYRQGSTAFSEAESEREPFETPGNYCSK